MKKASIIFSITGFLLLGITYYFMQQSSYLVTKSEQAALELEKVLRNNVKVLKKLIVPDNDDAYHYVEMDLKQEDYVLINDCMKFYINEESFNNANKCEELIVDAIIKNMGEVDFIEAIIGNMINYDNKVSLKYSYPQALFDTSASEASLKSKLMLVFINRYRDPVKLKAAFDNYKNYFFDNISKNLYHKLFEERINTFINSYKEIFGQEDKESFFKKIYFEAETRNNHSKYWNYTFWKRRELEKNDQIIYAILKEIKNHYEIR